MAEKVLVKEILTSEMIKAGAELVRYLDAEGIRVTSLLWWFESESKTWQLLVALPLLSDEGPNKTYEKIQNVLSNMATEDQPTLELAHITAIKTDDPRISSLRKMYKTKSTQVSGVSVAASTIDGHYIDDAFIYRST